MMIIHRILPEWVAFLKNQLYKEFEMLKQMESHVKGHKSYFYLWKISKNKALGEKIQEMKNIFITT